MGRRLHLTFIKKVVKIGNMKAIRSTVGKGMNLSSRVEKQRKGVGAYSRKAKYGNRFE
jgi:stalled ribosome alternative rescue factor ArfA